jgi:PhzF family phenazine biosynthesis protein
MSTLRLFQVDAFSAEPFGGNPAAVCPLDSWLPDDVMQSVAAENNLSETAFFVPRDDGEGAAVYDLRWFTPAVEADLCGHATLATAYVIFSSMDPSSERLEFHTRSGPLGVTREDDLLAMDFPASPPMPADLGDVAGALGAAPREVLKSMYGLAVFDGADEVLALRPDAARVASLDCTALIVSAPGRPGSGVDFVSRFFAPKAGIPEDPVTGSAHCVLIPYWARQLGKTDMLAHQVSPRGGELFCRLAGDRVRIAGRVAPYLEGTIRI